MSVVDLFLFQICAVFVLLWGGRVNLIYEYLVPLLDLGLFCCATGFSLAGVVSCGW